jgi:hypothetical protein
MPAQIIVVECDNMLIARSTFVRKENILTSRVSPINFKSFNGLQFRYFRNILSELNNIVSLINENFGISVLAITCWLLVSTITGLFSHYLN